MYGRRAAPGPEVVCTPIESGMTAEDATSAARAPMCAPDQSIPDQLSPSARTLPGCRSPWKIRSPWSAPGPWLL